MALTIDATVGGANSNSFVTEIEQIAYMAARLNASTWTTFTGTACTEPEKTAMIEATREISLRTWKGTRADSVQALSWPRWFVLNPDLPWSGIVYYASTVIPDRVKNATCELAFQYIKAGTSDVAAQDPLQNITERTVGPLRTVYSNPLNRRTGIGRFPRILDNLRPLLLSTRGSTPLVRG